MIMTLQMRHKHLTSTLTILTDLCNHYGFASGLHLRTNFVRDSETAYQKRRLQSESDCERACRWLGHTRLNVL